jgi:hypothetical protein
VICLSIFLIPYQVPIRPFTLEVLRAKECVPIPSPSIVFFFGLGAKSIKELRGASIRTCNISWQLVFWINAKLNGHCPCLDFGLLSHITLGVSKGNLMRCPITHTSHLRRGMKPINKNVVIFKPKHFQLHVL